MNSRRLSEFKDIINWLKRIGVSMSMKSWDKKTIKKIFYCKDPKGEIVSTPYWEKAGVIEHMEEILFPDTWEKLYEKGYRMIEVRSKEVI
jgi:hypothetical protein